MVQAGSHDTEILAGVANMFSARGFNIDSLVVGRTEDPGLSRMTIVVVGDDNTLEQVSRQLAKLVPVVQVRNFKSAAYIERDPGFAPFLDGLWMWLRPLLPRSTAVCEVRKEPWSCDLHRRDWREQSSS